MNSNFNASDALLHYIDALLFDGVVDEKECSEEDSVPQCTEKSAVVAEDIHKADPNSDLLQLLLFKVADIPLAMLRTKIATVVKVGRENLKPVTTGNGEVIRQFSFQGQEFHALEARDVILPNGYAARHVGEGEGTAYILILKGVSFGIICDEVGDSVDLERTKVEWRSQRPTRRWLAGMVKEYNHALLDEMEIIHIIERLLNISH